MYFDHVRCPSCGANFDPESIDTQGGVAACPACRSQLDVKSLFGVAAHLEEVESPQAHIDDLVSGHGQGDDTWRSTSAPDPMQGRGFQDRYAEEQTRRQAPRGHSTSMVRRVRGDDEDGGDEAPQASGPSAVLQALRDIKKGR